MRKATISVYTFEELDEKIQEKVLDKLREWNTEYDWWNSTYEDAKNVGLEIDSFDIYHRTITGKFITTAKDTADKILANHGDHCDTYKAAQHYLADLKALNASDDADNDNAQDDLTDDFRRSLLKAHLVMLSEEYDHLTNDKTLLEQIEEGEYEYYADGRQFMGEDN
jgi:hypothetical protein